MTLKADLLDLVTAHPNLRASTYAAMLNARTDSVAIVLKSLCRSGVLTRDADLRLGHRWRYRPMRNGDAYASCVVERPGERSRAARARRLVGGSGPTRGDARSTAGEEQVSSVRREPAA